MGFVTTIFLARVLGVEGFGFVGFVTALYGYFALFANPGFETVGTREIAKGKMLPADIISSLFVLRSGLAIGAFCILAVVAFVSPFSSVVRMMVLIQGCNLLVIPFMFQFFFRGSKDMAAVAYSRIVQSFSYMVLIFLLVSSEADLVRVPLIFLGANALSLLPLNARIVREFPLRSFRIDRGAIMDIARHTLHVGGAAILVQIYVSFDTIMLGYMRTAQEVGVYTAAYKIIAVLTLLPVLVFQAYLPELSKPGKDETADHTLTRYQTLLVASGIPVGLVGIVFARVILVGIFGDAFESGVLSLQILFVTTTIIYINIALANPLLAWGMEKEYLFIVGAGAIVNIFLNVALIPTYGIAGAASSTLAAEMTVLFAAFYRRRCLKKAQA